MLFALWGSPTASSVWSQKSKLNVPNALADGRVPTLVYCRARWHSGLEKEEQFQSRPEWCIAKFEVYIEMSSELSRFTLCLCFTLRSWRYFVTCSACHVASCCRTHFCGWCKSRGNSFCAITRHRTKFHINVPQGSRAWLVTKQVTGDNCRFPRSSRSLSQLIRFEIWLVS